MTHTVADVAERYGVSEATVLSWIGRGELASIDVSRKAGSKRPSWRVTDAALAAFEAARTATPPASKPTRRKPRPADVIRFYS